MRISKFIPIIFIIIASCGSSEKENLNDEAQKLSDSAIFVSVSSEESLSKKIDSVLYETDRMNIDAIISKSKKYKLNNGCNCSCVSSLSSNEKISFQDTDGELISFLITKKQKEITLTVIGTDTSAYYKPNNTIQFLDDKSKTITMFNHFTKHRQKSLVIICDDNTNFENLAKLKLLQNRNIKNIRINCLNSLNKEIDLNDADSKKLKCILNCY
jgi:predicted O-linked N-acetylglucosamine transferase (SPINDLY family)